jgi:hypothetical protein
VNELAAEGIPVAVTLGLDEFGSADWGVQPAGRIQLVVATLQLQRLWDCGFNGSGPLSVVGS